YGDWSSDVCSSDLAQERAERVRVDGDWRARQEETLADGLAGGDRAAGAYERAAAAQSRLPARRGERRVLYGRRCERLPLRNLPRADKLPGGREKRLHVCSLRRRDARVGLREREEGRADCDARSQGPYNVRREEARLLSAALLEC